MDRSVKDGQNRSENRDAKEIKEIKDLPEGKNASPGAAPAATPGATGAEKKRKRRGRGRAGQRAVSILLPVFGFLAVLIVLSIRWTLAQWSGLTMDEIIYELKAPLEGTGNNMIGDYILRCAVPAAAAAAAIIALMRVFRKKKHIRLVKNLSLAAAVAVIAVSVVYFSGEVGLGSYIENRNTTSDFIGQNYADPRSVSLTFPEKKRNLIYIYMESTEVTFTDKENGGAFDFDCIPELTELAQENEDFSGSDKKLNGGYAMPGATWTMAAIFGMTSGLPLNIDIERNSMSAMTSFFPQIRTLGDILEDEGYKQVFLLGSDATFGGRRLYFEEHGDYEIRDYLYAQETGVIPTGYKVWWGMEDEKLFSMAKDTITELAEGDEPFNATILTVDTHFTDGYVCELCGDEFGSNQYANVFACASRQVTSFVEWCREQDWYDNTTIVISGDHPTMDADFCADVPDSYSRRTYTCYINSAAETEEPDRRRDFSTFDNFPTTLAAMGVEIEGNRLGLGTNLFSSEDTLSEEFGADEVASEVSKKTTFLESLEALDAETEAKVAKYGAVTIKSVEYDDERHWITITTDKVDLPTDTGVKYIRLKIWCEKGGQMIRRWIKTKPTAEGGYYTTFDPRKDLAEFDEINYQFVIKLDTGDSYNLGPQGTVDNFTWLPDSENEITPTPTPTPTPAAADTDAGTYGNTGNTAGNTVGNTTTGRSGLTGRTDGTAAGNTAGTAGDDAGADGGTAGTAGGDAGADGDT